MTEKARAAAERIRKGIEEMEREKNATVIRFPNEGIRITQYQGYAKPARGLEPTTPMSVHERAANYKVGSKGKRVKLDPEVAQLYSPK
jgi:hypothetical protein